MQTKYKYIHFLETHSTGKTHRFHCCNNKSNEIIGIVKWYSAWRQYCYFSGDGTIYSQGCHDDISHFMKQLGKPEVKA